MRIEHIVAASALSCFALSLVATWVGKALESQLLTLLSSVMFYAGVAILGLSFLACIMYLFIERVRGPR